LVLRSLTLGFGYPLDEMVWLSHPGGSLSIPNALGLRSSELFSSRVIEKPFQVSLSALALPGKTLTTLPRRFSGLLPPRKPCPFVLPKCLARVGTSCSLELYDLSGSPSVVPWKRASTSFPSPLALTGALPYDKTSGKPQGIPVRQLGYLPITGRRPVWPFRSQTLSNLFG